MIELLHSDTRHGPEEAIQQIEQLRDLIPEEYRHAPRILWRSAAITTENARAVIAGNAAPTMYRKFASWAAERKQAAQFFFPNANPAVLYRSNIDSTKIIFNAEFAPGNNTIPNIVGEIVVEMDQRSGNVSFSNIAGMAVTSEQYHVLTGKTIAPAIENYVLRFAGGRIARVDPGPGYNIFKL